SAPRRRRHHEGARPTHAERAVEREQPLGASFPGELLLRAPRSGSRQALPLRVVVEQLSQQRAQRFVITWRKEPPGGAVPQQPAGPADVGRDQTPPRCPRLEAAEPEGLVPTRE